MVLLYNDSGWKYKGRLELTLFTTPWRTPNGVFAYPRRECYIAAHTTSTTTLYPGYYGQRRSSATGGAVAVPLLNVETAASCECGCSDIQAVSVFQLFAPVSMLLYTMSCPLCSQLPSNGDRTAVPPAASSITGSICLGLVSRGSYPVLYVSCVRGTSS